jgi:hypothetical protein
LLGADGEQHRRGQKPSASPRVVIFATPTPRWPKCDRGRPSARSTIFPTPIGVRRRSKLIGVNYLTRPRVRFV